MSVFRRVGGDAILAAMMVYKRKQTWQFHINEIEKDKTKIACYYQ